MVILWCLSCFEHAEKSVLINHSVSQSISQSINQSINHLQAFYILIFVTRNLASDSGDRCLCFVVG
jgi:hypothetical protein